MKISVVGTGYVGLVSGVCLAEVGHEVVCVDNDAAKVDKINADIEGFRTELSEIVANAKQGEQAIIGSTIQKKKQELEYKIRKAEVEKNKIQLKRRESIDKLGAKLGNINMLLAPVIILLVSIVISIRRNVRKRHYISHASDA